MNSIFLLSLGIGLSLFLAQGYNSSIISPSKINLENNLYGYPRIQMKDVGQKAPLIIVLHGRGGNEKALQNVIPKNLPARIIFLRGQINEKTGNYFFKSRVAGPENKLKEDLENSGLILDEAITKLTQIYPTNKVILFGFSQGAALSLYMGSIGAVDNVIAFSGSLSKNLFPAKQQNTQILMWHGTNDKVVPFKLGKDTKEAFENMGFSTEFIVGKNKGHILPPKDVVEKYFKMTL
jgi:predicted esterase